ncbi:gluconate transport-inducing protein [Hamiltosporidium tvaerminnensis]|nr:gluconate transport-inducing protein [Hamiltosporidium tvaerminnensis]TBU08885.1 gluconate transport-inducing protein [Hamiltosporidium magnivora]TBU09086.1 gluconate transport-inducing protein [Hamiltosporidium magnivora]
MHAIRLGLVEPVRDRLCIEERELIRSGCIFCFIETKEGMKRWTDGKIWSPSKIVGHFLLYKQVPRHLSKSSLKKGIHNGSNYMKNGCSLAQSINDKDESEKLTFFKKTISIPFDKKTYHIISYYQPLFAKHGISDIPFFKDLSRSLNDFPILNDEKYLQSLKEKNLNIANEFNLTKPAENNMHPMVDRDELEKLAAGILVKRLRLEY